ncbi:hypothetical protein [Candidatus Uabimicrobium sp. HlEnr_7]|uniref:hypothetical protein n=1 Tax=Candidatus Uabimicrobium helgolandensis TaxID=3095367 RepID=UPI0035562E0E
MNNEKWMDELIASFPNPQPQQELISKIQQQMALAIVEKKRLSQKMLLSIIAITLATIPLFSLTNYFYYILLQQIITTYFPQMLTSFLVLFTISVSLIGAICYGFIPIWLAYFLNRNFHQSSAVLR